MPTNGRNTTGVNLSSILEGLLKADVKIKRTSKHPIDRQRLPVLEETLRQLEERENPQDS